MSEELFENWVPGIIYDVNPNDFMVSSETPLIIPRNENKTKYFYNQAAQSRTRNACWLYAAAGVVSDYTGSQFTTKQLLEIVDLAEKSYGWKEDGGMYMSKAVDCVRTWWNLHNPDKELMTWNVRVGTEKYHEALEKGHSLAIGYNTGNEYTIDSQKDGIVEIETYRENGGGHLVRCAYDLGNFLIRDNYFQRKKFNSYTNNKIEILRKNWHFFPSAYIFLYKDKRDVAAQEDRIAKEIEMKILDEVENGTKRITIYDNLRREGYTKRNILLGMRRALGMHITENMFP